MFEVTREPESNRVVVVFSEDFNHSQDEFDLALMRAAMDVRSQEESFDLLVDFTAAPTMDDASAEAAQNIIDWCISRGLRKSANVVDEVVLKMQIKRVSSRDDRFQYFATRAEADRWLAQ